MFIKNQENTNHKGSDVYFTVPDIPWNSIDPKKEVIIFLLHYLTLEEARGLVGKHTASAMHSNGRKLPLSIWEYSRQCIGPELYVRIMTMDAILFSIPYQGIPTDVYLEKNFKLVMDAWRQVNIAILNSNAVIAFGSKDTKNIFTNNSIIQNNELIIS